jgi:signal transduction histidine kinase
LIQIQDEERRHIARELHDSAGQTLAALGMILAQLAQDVRNNPAQLAKDIEDAEGLVQHLNREIRTTSYLLHPPLLDESGLSSALDWYVQGLKERSGLDIDLRIPENFERLPADMELVVFRLVQESLTNVHRHSGSKTASIRVAREADRVIVEVQDKGSGMSAERLAEIQSKGTGVGIMGMRERLRPFNGELVVESNNEGTKIVATLLAKAFLAKEQLVGGHELEVA